MRLSPRPSRKLSPSAFADYASAAPAVRAALGLARLSPKLAAEVRSAVAKHAERACRKPAPGSIMDRLREQIRVATQDAVAPYTDHHRSKGDAVVRVTIGHEPRAYVNAPTKWVSGRGGFGNVVTDTTEHIAVMPAWRRRVLARGMARLDGMLTTHADPVLSDGDIVVYRAAWVRQRAGYNIAAECGYIAHHAPSGTAYHATDSTPEKTLAGLRRKMRIQSIPSDVRAEKRAASDRKRAERRAAALDKLAGQLSRLDLSEIGHVVVSRSDSLRAGNCVPGTDDFIGRFLPGRESATVAEIARAVGRSDVATLAGADLTLARQLGAAVLVAVRRDRNARRLVGV